MSTRQGWVICSQLGQPMSGVFDDRDTADRERRSWASGHYYHVRPCTETITVHGSAPEEWCFVAPLPSRTINA